MTARDRLEAALVKAATPRARHVFTALMETTARAEADAADIRARAGISLGPLDGKIVSIKDLFDVAGMETWAGSKIRKGAGAALADAPAIARLRRAGAVLIGRTNMSEFAFSGLGLNPHWGTPGNAHDSTRVPGGSTSGGAVSVALGIADLTLGTDTGGSTRVPAAFNGIVGFKPTSHRIPKAGCFPLSQSLDSIGPLGSSVADCAAMDSILATSEADRLTPLSLNGVRIGVPRGFLFEEMEAAVGAAFEAALRALEKAGASLCDIDVEDLLAESRAALQRAPIVACEAAAIHADYFESRAADFDPRVRGRIAGGTGVSAIAYIQTMLAREALKARFSERFAASATLLALPTAPIRAAEIAPIMADDALFTKTNLLTLRNTNVFNFFDCPAISLPLPIDGLPAGLMLVSPAGQDRRLFAFAASAEAALR
ncbi:MAG: amidase [Proteobacteria bacterium]|nr:amidase [Pseudomonadota bacterium]